MAVFKKINCIVVFDIVNIFTINASYVVTQYDINTNNYYVIGLLFGTSISGRRHMLSHDITNVIMILMLLLLQ